MVSVTGPDEWRIVLVGNTGSGKSSAGNTILGREAFVSELSAASVTTDCQKERGEAGGRRLALIDTPGLFDTSLSQDEVWQRIRLCVGMSSPGPHAFLVILQLGRFTAEEKQTVKLIQEAFGDDADKHTMVLFTHGDKLKKQSIQEFISKSSDLQRITAKCHGRHHVFNNEADDPAQVLQLLQKVGRMIEDNGGSHYTTEMFRRAEDEIERKKQQLLEESEERRSRELQQLRAREGEALRLQQEVERLQREAEQAARAQAERQNQVQPRRRRCLIL